MMLGDDFFDPFRLMKKIEKAFFDTSFEKSFKNKKEPLVDVSETKNEIKVVVELPGVEKKDIDLELKNNYLVIRASLNKSSKKEDKNYFFQERNYQEYYRVVPLPAEVDESKVDAKYNNGILEVTLKKKASSKSKKTIKIK